MRNRRTFAGILLAMYLLFGLPGNTKENVEQPVSNPTTQETTEETVKTSLTEDYTLYRIHTVEAGDSLSILSSESNTTIKYLKQINELTSDNIYIGQKLIIPYVVDKEELKYYTTSVELTDETLEDIAEKYNTDLKTLYALNVEAFYFDGDGYILLTDTILVPTFPTSSEVDELKKADSYRKVNQ
jgi:LysM repeat protein